MINNGIFHYFKASQKKASLEKYNGLHRQYERLLEQYAEYLATAQGKLKQEDQLVVGELADVEQQLQTHTVSHCAYIILPLSC